MKIEMDIDETYDEVTVIIKAPNMSQEVLDLMGRFQSVKNFIGYKEGEACIIQPDTIFLFYCEGRKVYCDALNGTYEIKEKLYEIEEQVNQYSFVRISKSAIVNMKKIRSIEMDFGNCIFVRFINGRQEPVSRRFVSKLKQRLGISGGEKHGS